MRINGYLNTQSGGSKEEEEEVSSEKSGVERKVLVVKIAKKCLKRPSKKALPALERNSMGPLNQELFSIPTTPITTVINTTEPVSVVNAIVYKLKTFGSNPNYF
ncbi:hypothetical protein BpHYR1_010580 [Brachionus plicatilis]|uniref:Uncharacterized protein n=1 Tax=Brachionus plicatilis TaxID=10195 RepID=A0A3M7QJZ4_BRAPC|nr:hypothetical protein BpHYR1_010580 [Brachionus plicatilis]